MRPPTKSDRHAAYPGEQALRGVRAPGSTGATACASLRPTDQPTGGLSVPASLPDASTRWRCAGCGNLTRFDVTRTRRTTEFWHFDLAGEHRVEESRTDHEEVSAVPCRWCGRSDAIQLVSRAEADASTP